MPNPEPVDYAEVVRAYGAHATNDFRGEPKPTHHVDLLTLDTNLIRDYWDQRPRKQSIERLLELAQAGEIDLVVTRYIEDDVPESPLRDRIAELPELNVAMTGGLFTLDSALDGPDVIGSDLFQQCQDALAGWRPSTGDVPDWRDWRHLHMHYAHRHDFFLTWDNALLELGLLLECGFPLGAMKPDAYLESRA